MKQSFHYKAVPILFIICLLLSPVFHFRVFADEDADALDVLVFSIEGEINKGQVYLLHRAIEEVKGYPRGHLVIEIDTNGGRLDSTQEMMQMLIPLEIPTSTFVKNKAFSAGAFIAVATDTIYMSPASVIGAATPIVMGGEEMPKSVEEKMTSGTMALIRTAAEHKKHPKDIVSAMVDRDVAIEGLIEKGKLLTLTDTEAEAQHLSKGTVNTIEELLEKEHIENYRLHRLEISWSEDLVLFLTNSAVSGVLMMIAIGGLYLELQSPGLGWPGVIALLCFALFFGAHQLAGLAGLEDIVLFIIGILLLALEIFVVPGFGVLGVLGVLALLSALVLAMVRGPHLIPTGSGEEHILPFIMPDLTGAVISVSIALLGSVALIILSFKVLPRTSAWSRIALLRELKSEEGFSSPSHKLQSLKIGQIGKTTTVLRPSGKVVFDNSLYDVVTEDTFIEKGMSVQIIAIEGSRIVVEKTEDV